MTVKRTNIVANFEARSVALVASWTLAGAALAQGAPPPPPSRDGRAVSTLFQLAGRNVDVRLSHSEAASARERKAVVDRLDSDGRGSLGPEGLDPGTQG